jgi:dTDP-4-dehydrorhamnose 3,5-epimerase
MVVHETALSGVLIVEADRYADDRGAIMPAWIADEFAARGLASAFAQCNLVRNRRRGTLRGLHYQDAPYAETKLVRAVRGVIYDVAVDLRPASPTFCRWVGVELDAASPRLLYLPEGIAHGYQTLTDDAEMLYFITQRYRPDYQRGVRWDDPAFGVAWPIQPPAMLHPRDASFPDFQPPVGTGR